MSAIIPTPPPAPRCPINIRPATMNDLAFIDSLQKLHAKQVGWMPTKQLEGKIEKGQVIVAEEERGREGEGATRREEDTPSSGRLVALSPCRLVFPVGYCIAHDQYFKRDDVGIIYQMNVVPGKQRGFIGAMLLKA